MSNYGPQCVCMQEGCDVCFPNRGEVDERLITNQIGELRTAGEKFLLEWFGPRCDEYDDNCELCLRWLALDMLTDNPWKGMD